MSQQEILSINDEKNFETKITNYIQNSKPLFLKEINLSFSSSPFKWNMDEHITLEDIKNIIEGPQKELIYDDNFDETLDSIYCIKNINKTKMKFISINNSTNLLSKKPNKSLFKEKESPKKIIKFETVLHRKRGRKDIGDGNMIKCKKCHISDDFDNIQRKIQVHFFRFLIRLANDAIKNILSKKTKLSFKDIKYELKRIVNLNYVETLKECKYSDIIQKEISPKNKKFCPDENKKVYIKVCQISEKLKSLFEKNYLYIFQKYYYQIEKDEKEINIDGIKINLSSKTKGFYGLLEKNEINKEKFKKIVNDIYFSGKNYLKEKKFLISS